jgi:hypothetical protein
MNHETFKRFNWPLNTDFPERRSYADDMGEPETSKENGCQEVNVALLWP